MRRQWGAETAHQILDGALAENDHRWFEQNRSPQRPSRSHLREPIGVESPAVGVDERRFRVQNELAMTHERVLEFAVRGAGL